MENTETIEQLILYRNVARATNGWAVVSSKFLDSLCEHLKAEPKEPDESLATYGRT